MRSFQKRFQSMIYEKIDLFFSNLQFIVGFVGIWIFYSFLILKNISKDTKKYNLSFWSISYNALFKYPLLGYFPEDFFCYKLYENNYKNYISQIEYFVKNVKRNYYFHTPITNKLFFKQEIMNKIKTPKLIAYFNHKKNKIEKFSENKFDKIIIKPVKGYRGIDIKIVKSDNLIESLKKCKKSYIAEEFVQQHHFVNEIFRGSVNTIRILTFNKNGEIKIIKGTLKVGRNKDAIVDNVSKGGIGINLNLETGNLGKGYTSYRNGFVEYKSHPLTNYEFFGKKIPYLDEIKEMAVSTHQLFPKYKIVGWDIAITETGPTMIEGNLHPNITGMQLHEPLKKKLLSK